jgi:hypothetical protein
LAQASPRERLSPLASSRDSASRGWGHRAESYGYASHRPRVRTVYYYPYVSLPCRAATVPRGTLARSPTQLPRPASVATPTPCTP